MGRCLREKDLFDSIGQGFFHVRLLFIPEEAYIRECKEEGLGLGLERLVIEEDYEKFR